MEFGKFAIWAAIGLLFSLMLLGCTQQGSQLSAEEQKFKGLCESTGGTVGWMGEGDSLGCSCPDGFKLDLAKGCVQSDGSGQMPPELDSSADASGLDEMGDALDAAYNGSDDAQGYEELNDILDDMDNLTVINES
jgi:hypothetical protein